MELSGSLSKFFWNNVFPSLDVLSSQWYIVNLHAPALSSLFYCYCDPAKSHRWVSVFRISICSKTCSRNIAYSHNSRFHRTCFTWDCNSWYGRKCLRKSNFLKGGFPYLSCDSLSSTLPVAILLLVLVFCSYAIFRSTRPIRSTQLETWRNGYKIFRCRKLTLLAEQKCLTIVEAQEW